VAVGEVVAAHALRGFVRVRGYQPAPPSLAPGRHVLLERAGSLTEIEVESVAPHARGLLLVAFVGVSDRDDAEALVGMRIRVPVADLAPLEADEFYYHEIEGFAVETTTGEALGTVRETFSTGLNDVWVIDAGTGERLIPAIADVVRTIDRRARRIVIEPMPGLLD
jgi:16S rRNA processing protein RimM